MKSTQAWGWLAAGVVALGLNGIYHDGGAEMAHRTVDRVIGRVMQQTGPVLAFAAGRSDLLVAKNDTVAAHSEASSCPWATAIARVKREIGLREAEFADSDEEMSAAKDAELAQVEAGRARIEAQVARVRMAPVAFEMRMLPVVCPRVQVNVPRVSIPKIPMVNVPEVHVNLGTGPV